MPQSLTQQLSREQQIAALEKALTLFFFGKHNHQKSPKIPHFAQRAPNM